MDFFKHQEHTHALCWMQGIGVVVQPVRVDRVGAQLAPRTHHCRPVKESSVFEEKDLNIVMSKLQQNLSLFSLTLVALAV